jgi:glutamyl-tRNA reductase
MTQPAAHFLLVGASHHTAPLALRERLTLSPEKQTALTTALRTAGLAGEVCVLNTCNRIEVYATAPTPEATTAVATEFCRLQDLPVEEFSAVARQCRDRDAVAHLFEVAAGLDSQIVGETEILGQVKEAYATAQAAGTIGSVLNRIFQKAFQCAKVVRSETAIGEGQVSVATVAVALAEKIFGHLQHSHVLVVGAGDIAEKTAKALRSRDARTITFTNRTASRAEQLAQEFGGEVLPFENLAGGLGCVDIVVCSTAAPSAVVTTDMVRRAIHERPSRPLFLIDLALPRDIEPEAADLPNVFVYNLDDLAKLAEQNIAARRAELDRARQLIAERAVAVWHKVSGLPPPS